LLLSPTSAATNVERTQLSEVVVECSADETLPTVSNVDPSPTEDFPPTDIDAIVTMFHNNDVKGLERKLEEVTEEGKLYKRRKQPKDADAPEQNDPEPEYWWDDEFARTKPAQPSVQSVLRDFRNVLEKYKEQGLRPANPDHLKIAFDCSDEEDAANRERKKKQMKSRSKKH
ncbi:hypothetical protein OESDEN_02457, partial [Oesophagostomum dentatum]